MRACDAGAGHGQWQAGKGVGAGEAGGCDRDRVSARRAVKVEVLDVQETTKKEQAKDLFRYL